MASTSKGPASMPSEAELEAVAKHGLNLREQGRLAEAKAIYEALVALQPSNYDAINVLGAIAFEMGDFRAAADLIGQVVAAYPQFVPGHFNRAMAFERLGRLDDALAAYETAVALKRDHADAQQGRAAVLWALGRAEEALAGFDAYLALRPDDADAWNNRGTALARCNRPAEALASYGRALALNPNSAQAHSNRGVTLAQLRRLDEALASYLAALALMPDNAETWSNFGNALRELRRPKEAIAAYDKALALNPELAETHFNRGNALMDLKRPLDALAAYEAAIARKSDHAQAFQNRGYALEELRRIDEAQESFATAFALSPEQDFLFGAVLHSRARLCAWDGLSDDLARYEAAIAEGRAATAPFAALALLDRPDLHRRAAKLFADRSFPADSSLGPCRPRTPDGKIRLGYYSADFHSHATIYLMIELLERHNRDRFELYGFSFGPSTEDAMQQRTAAAFDRFVDVREKSDRDIASLSREWGIDIAVDLKGYTKDSRAGIFVERCAPIQVSYLGYPGTVGTKHLDYVIADAVVIPPEAEADYSEQVVTLPHSYQVNDSKRAISPRVFTRADVGLPAERFVFCCFNNIYKILPPTFDVWMRILGAVEGSVLWLLEGNATATRNLRREAERRGIAGERLIFAPPMDPAEHLARHKVADLFLDTWPYNAHTTASDALWSGLPVLTCPGRSFASRVAASLLTALELPELITADPHAFADQAIAYATDADKLREVREKLIRNRQTSPLFDGALFAKHLEAAFEAMFARHRAGQPPARMRIEG